MDILHPELVDIATIVPDLESVGVGAGLNILRTGDLERRDRPGAGSRCQTFATHYGLQRTAAGSIASKLPRGLQSVDDKRVLSGACPVFGRISDSVRIPAIPRTASTVVSPG